MGFYTMVGMFPFWFDALCVIEEALGVAERLPRDSLFQRR